MREVEYSEERDTMEARGPGVGETLSISLCISTPPSEDIVICIVFILLQVVFFVAVNKPK